MRRAGWAAWLLLAAGAWAEPKIVRMRFPTTPAATNVYHAFDHIGNTTENVTLDKSRFTEGTVELTFRAPGYRDYVLYIPSASMQDGATWKPIHLPSWRDNVPYGAALVLVGLSVFAFSRRQNKKIAELTRRESILAEVDPSDSLSSTLLGGYRLLDRLGRGGMASVYRGLPADSLDPAAAVAVKVMRKDIVDSAEFVDRFRREAKHTASLDHPHVVRLLDYGQDGKFAYLVMELIEGGNLRERMTGQPLPPQEAWSALQAVCAALCYAHDKGIVHRDIKPENLMISKSGILKVTDFGLARAESQDRITATGQTLGTPAYMAPEQIQGVEPVPAMDQYAVGILAFELVTGRIPFESNDPVQQIFQTLTEEPPPPSKFVTVSGEVDRVILQMIAKRPDDRFPTLRQAAAALEQALAD